MKSKTFNNLLLLSLVTFINLSGKNSLAATYSCINEIKCDIESTGSQNTVNLSGNLVVVNLNSNSDINSNNNIISIVDPTYIDIFTYKDTNLNSNYQLYIDKDDKLTINTLNADGLTIDFASKDNSVAFDISFGNAVFSNGIFAKNNITKIEANNIWKITSQNSKDLTNTILDLSNQNIDMDITFNNQDNTTGVYSFILSNNQSLGSNTSLKLNNVNSSNIYLYSIDSKDLYAKTISIIYKDTNKGSIYLEANNLYTYNLIIKNGDLFVNNNTYLTSTDFDVDNIIVKSDGDNPVNLNIHFSSNINYYGSSFHHIASDNGAPVNLFILTDFNTPTKSIEGISIGRSKEGWDSNTIETDNNYASYFNDITMKHNLPIGNSYLTFEGYVSVNNLYLINKISLSLDHAYLDIKGNNQNLNVISLDLYNSSKLVITDDSSLVTNSMSYINKDSSIIGGKITFGWNTEIDLTSFNQNNYVLDVYSFSQESTSYMALKLDTGSMLNVGETYTYHVVKSQTPIIVDFAIYGYYDPADWITFNPIVTENTIEVEAIRTQSYSDVLTSSNNYNEFTLNLASAIDNEMSTSTVSKELSQLIYNLDTSSHNAAGLQKNLDSMGSIDRSFYINTLSKNDSNIMDLMKHNITSSNSIWIYSSYNKGKTQDDYKDNSITAAIGFNLALTTHNKLGLSVSLSDIKLNSTNADSSIQSMGIGLIYGYELNNFNINVGILNTFNQASTDRFDNMGGIYKSHNNYNNTMLGLLIGHDLNITSQNIVITNAGYLNYDYINMKEYQEEGSIGYEYGKNHYNTIEAGYTLGLKSKLHNGFNWDLKSDFGYKNNRGNQDNILLHIDSTSISIEYAKVKSSGFIINPKAGISYINNNFTIDGIYEFEYMNKTYSDHKIRLLFRYRTN